jgi:hypothetical protein
MRPPVPRRPPVGYGGDPWDAIADGLDDLERIIDEQEDRLPEGVRKKTVRRLRAGAGAGACRGR